MASYEELYNMIAEESVKGSIGRAGLKAIDTAQKIPDKYASVKDKVKEKVSKKETDGPVKSATKEAIRATAKATKSVVDNTSAAVVNAMDKSSEAIARTVTAPEKMKIKKENKSDPNKLKEKLESMEKKIQNVKEKVMTGQVAVSSFIAVGPLDAALKAMIANGSAVTKNKMASKALVSGMLLAPALAKKLVDIAQKKITGKEAETEYSSIASKVVNTLGEWAKSDLKPEALPNKGAVTEFVGFTDIDSQFVEWVYESLENEEITAETAQDLLTFESNDIFMTVLECGKNGVINNEDFDYLLTVLAN